MRCIYWYCIDMLDSDERFVSNALKELSQNLKKPPVEVEITTEKLPEKLSKEISRLLAKPQDFVHTAGSITDELTTESGLVPGLLVYCEQNSTLAQESRKANPDALWGARCGRLALAWQPNNKMLLWHETLHLLGAEDCYNSQSQVGTCEKEPRCIMQYAPTEESILEWPECLCLGTIELLRSSASDLRGKNRKVKEFIEKHFDEETRLCHYSRYRESEEICDPMQVNPPGYKDSTLGFHTVLVSRDTSFESACAVSNSFSYFGKDVNAIPHGSHQTWVLAGPDKKEKEHMSVYKTEFSDGSCITLVYRYRPQEPKNRQGRTGRGR